MPKRIQLRRTKGWRKPPGVIVVARPTKWGNPFRTGDRQKDYDSYMACVNAGFPVPPAYIDLWNDAGGDASMLVVLSARVRSVLDELRGHDLACWCPLDQPCHADVLLEIASAPQEDGPDA